MDVWSFSELETGRPGLTPAEARSCVEAASICLDHNQHGKPVELTAVRESLAIRRNLAWPEVTPQMRRAYRDLAKAVERGAVALAALYAERALGLVVVEQSQRGAGFDYWLGEGIDPDAPLDAAARLEVSGNLNGDLQELQGRLREKIERLERFGTEAAWVIVVGFKQPMVRVVYYGQR